MTKLLLFISLVCVGAACANKDRISSPIKTTCIRSSGDTGGVACGCLGAVGSQRCIESRFEFESGEVLTIKCSGGRIASVSISDDSMGVFVPDSVIEKLTHYKLNEPTIQWDVNSERARDAGLFVIHFDVGVKPVFGALPYLQIEFLNRRFFRAMYWERVTKEIEQRYKI